MYCIQGNYRKHGKVDWVKLSWFSRTFTVNIYIYVYSINWKSRQVVVSCEAEKKQHAWPSSGLCDHYGKLFTWMADLNFYIAVAQHYYSYRLVYYKPSTSCWVESIAEGLIKSVQPFLRTTSLWGLALIFVTTDSTHLPHALMLNLECY